LIEITEEQRRIVESKEAIIQVQAFAGTGKTTVIRWCVDRAIAQQVRPSAILCLTFSNSARETLRQRLPADVNIATVHASALSFVTDTGEAPGHHPSFSDDPKQAQKSL
jgi:superfamily I DNA/RNA helicase